MVSVWQYSFSKVYREPEYRFPDGTEFVDLSSVPGTSCYCDDDAREAIRCYFDQAGRAEKSLNFIDSGDYHYVSALSIERIREPFSLVLLDNHPDMQAPAFGGDILSCGGWVRWALERMPMLQRVLIIGIDPSLAGETEGFGSRVTVLPREETDSGQKQLAALKTWLGASREPVYLSIDKDVLAPEFASTDWDQGSMTQDTLLEICRTVAGCGRLLGTDVCGELPAAKGGMEKDFIKNSAINNRIYQNLFLYLKD